MSTALIVLDVQESFRHTPYWAELSNPDIVADVMTLVTAARAGGKQVIWVWHESPESGTVFDPIRGLITPLVGLDIGQTEAQITKTSRNAFTTTNLGQLLTRAGIRHVVIAGIQTEQCCETTARLAADLGCQVTFVTDATATFPIRRPDTGELLDAGSVITRTEYALAGRFATIATVDQAVAQLKA